MSTPTSPPILSPSELSYLESLLPFATEAELLQLKELLSIQAAEIKLNRTTAENPATKTPATFAAAVSSGRWRIARHIELMDRCAMAAVSGEGSRRLIITLPPRHGKSEYWSHYLPAWHVGRFPDKRVLLVSYEAGFAEWWGGRARETLEAHCDLFGVKIRSDSHAKSRWEIAGHVGGMQTAGVGGAITGKGADILIVDDPIKNAEEAASETMRKATWDWWTSTAYTRLEPDGIVVLIQTRWHEDDLAGRLIAESRAENAEPWRVINLPAIAEGGGDILGRLDGEPLWPERWSLDRLLKIKQAAGPRVWSALYQQRPAPASGLFFDPEWFGRVEAIPAGCSYVRYWDIAGAKPGKGDWTVGCLMARSPGPESEAKFYVADMVRFQKSPSDRNRTIIATAADDKQRYGRVPIWIERGIGLGKESTDSIIRMLAGYVVRDDSIGKDKETRAEPLRAQAEAGNVKVLLAPWNRPLFDEMVSFPFGANDDQVDALSGAFNKLATPTKSFYVGVA